MALQLRQICLVARELAPAIRDLREVFALEPCFVDPAVAGFGLENTLLSVGTGFLEVVAPIRDGTAAGRYLDRRGGDGGYMVITQTSDAATQAEVRARAAVEGVRVVLDHVDGSYHIMQLHPGDLQAAFLEVDWDEHGELEGFWGAAGGRAWQQHVRDDVVAGFLGAELQAQDPRALAALWSRVSGLPVEDDAEGRPSLALRNARLRFVPERDGRGPGLSAVDLAVRDRAFVLAAARRRGALAGDDVVQLCGTRFHLHDHPLTARARTSPPRPPAASL